MSVPTETTIIGLGLIGGSLARDLAGLGVRITAHDTSEGVVDQAIAAGVVAAPLGPAEPIHGLVVIGTPVDHALDVLRDLADRLADDAVVTDVGSTKREIERVAQEIGLGERFVGSHPMAGDHRSGWRATRTDLFRGATVYLSRSPEDPAARTVAAMWEAVGSQVVPVDSEEHDRRLAWTSHLPQALSTALANVLTARGLLPADIGPGGRDMIRLAASSPEMWTPISLSNREHLAVALREVEDCLAEFRTALESGDQGAVLDFFERGRDGLV